MKNKKAQIQKPMQPLTEVTEKKSRLWIWILIIIILIIVGIGIYFWLSGGSDGGSSVLGGIPSPPALPN